MANIERQIKRLKTVALRILLFPGVSAAALCLSCAGLQNNAPISKTETAASKTETAKTAQPKKAATAAPNVVPQFEDYKVASYTGKINQPEWIKRGDDGEWRDDLEKTVDAPVVNFAGKYFIAVHSCGTACNYYTLTDLSSGRDVKALADFDLGGSLPKTSDGYEYTSELIYKPDSKMLVAQYQVDLRRGKEECRERAFLFENEKLAPISSTKRGCRKF